MHRTRALVKKSYFLSEWHSSPRIDSQRDVTAGFTVAPPHCAGRGPDRSDRAARRRAVPFDCNGDHALRNGATIFFRCGPASYVPAEAMERGLIDNTVDAGILLDRARALAALPPAAFATTKHEIRQAALERAKLDAYPRSSRSGPPPIRSIASAITSPAPWGRKLSPSRLHPATRPTGRRPPHTRSGARRVAATTKVAQDALVGSDPAAGAPS